MEMVLGGMKLFSNYSLSAYFLCPGTVFFTLMKLSILGSDTDAYTKHSKQVN